MQPMRQWRYNKKLQRSYQPIAFYAAGKLLKRGCYVAAVNLHIDFNDRVLLNLRECFA